MPSWKVSRKSSLSNQISHFGIMGGLSNSRVTTHTNRATNTLRIPKPTAAGLKFMQMNNLLSKNPQGSGGIGRMEKNSPCNCEKIKLKNDKYLDIPNPVVRNCDFCYTGDGDPDKRDGCAFKSPNSNNYYCCPSGNYDTSGCNDSSGVVYINHKDINGCLQEISLQGNNGVKCVWTGDINILDMFSADGVRNCSTVIIASDLLDISRTIVVPPGKTLISYGDLTFVESTTSKYLDISGVFKCYGNITFKNVHEYGIFINSGADVHITGDVSFLNIDPSNVACLSLSALTEDIKAIFDGKISFGDITNGVGGIISDVNRWKSNATFNNKVSFSNIIFPEGADPTSGGIITLSKGNIIFNDNVSFGDINRPAINLGPGTDKVYFDSISINSINDTVGMFLSVGVVTIKDISFANISRATGVNILPGDPSVATLVDISNIYFNEILDLSSIGISAPDASNIKIDKICAKHNSKCPPFDQSNCNILEIGSGSLAGLTITECQ